MKKKLVILTTLTLLIGILPAIWDHGYYILNCDFSWQEIPLIIETKRMLASGVPLWSWNTYFGDSFIASYSFYTLGSPFVWINCLFPNDLMLYGITFTLWLKFVVCALITYAYLRKMRFDGQLSALGALLYTFSSYAISNVIYYHFMEPMMCFPVLLMAIERYLRGERYGRTALVGASFLIPFVNFYFLPCSLFSGVLYALMRMHHLRCQRKWHLVWQAALLIALGVTMAAVLLLPTLLHLSGATGSRYHKINVGLMLLDCVERVRTLVMPKLYEGVNYFFFRSAFSSNAVSVAVGGLCFGLAYVWHRRRQLDWLSWLLIACLVLYVTPLNGIFSFFTDISYSRWAYAFTLFIILATLTELREGNYTMRDFWRYLWVTVVVLAVVYVWSFIGTFDGIPRAFIPYNWIFFGLLVLGFALLWWWMRRSRSIGVLTLLVAGFAALQFFSSFLIREGYVAKAFGINYLIQDREEKYFADNDYPYNTGNFHYRTDFVTSGVNIYSNQASYKNWPSVTSFSSVQNKVVMPLFALGDSSRRRPSRIQFIPQIHRTSFDALMSVKTVVDYHDRQGRNDTIQGLKEVRRTSNYTVNDFEYYIPMGFTYDTYVNYDTIAHMIRQHNRNWDMPLQVLANMAVNHGDTAEVARYLKPGVIDTTISLDSVVVERRKVVCDRFEGDTRGFRAHIILPRTNYVFFSVPCDPGFTATVDGREVPIIKANCGLSAVLVPKGSHNIEFAYFPPGLKEGAAVTAVALLLLLIIAWRDWKVHN